MQTDVTSLTVSALLEAVQTAAVNVDHAEATLAAAKQAARQAELAADRERNTVIGQAQAERDRAEMTCQAAIRAAAAVHTTALARARQDVAEAAAAHHGVCRAAAPLIEEWRRRQERLNKIVAQAK